VTFAAKGRADPSTSQPVDSTPMTKEQREAIAAQKYVELIQMQKDDSTKSHERAVHLQDEAQQIHDRNVKIQDEEGSNQARFAKILSTWERQQQQYQAYLDSLKH